MCIYFWRLAFEAFGRFRKTIWILRVYNSLLINQTNFRSELGCKRLISSTTGFIGHSSSDLSLLIIASLFDDVGGILIQPCVISLPFVETGPRALPAHYKSSGIDLGIATIPSCYPHAQRP